MYINDILVYFQLCKGACKAFGICVAKVQRKQVIHQLSEEQVDESRNGLFGACVVLGRGES
jgi:hypothetical protein